MTSEELDSRLYEQLKGLCAEGDCLVEANRYREAYEKYTEAWKLLPEPKTMWKAATWVLAAIGDLFFITGKFQQANDAFVHAMACPDAIGNPFLHLRLGQTSFELGLLDVAADELTRAYMGAGLDIFAEQHDKYLEFLKTRIDL